MGFVSDNPGFSVDWVVAVASLIGVWLLASRGKWFQKQWRFMECAAAMPGPPALPLIGNVLDLACSYDEILPKLVEIAQPYSIPFRCWLGPKLIVAMRNPRDIGVVMSSPIATDKPYEYRFIASYMGLGIATDSETIMGTTGSAQHGGYKGFMTCSARAFGLAYERTLKGWLHPDWIYSRTNDGHQYAKDMKILHEFTDNLIRQKKKEYYASEPRSDSRESSLTPVLDRLTAHNEKTKLMDDIRFRDEISNIWMPAQDPTALTSSFLFVMLGKHPEVQDKVREEVREVIGDAADITLEHLSKLKYLEMVFKETVRLFPVGPIISRELRDDLEFETCTAPKGCIIILFVYMAHRDPNYWTEPEKFNPERFTPENSVGRHPYAFVPFSSGIRGCIGQKYATMMMKVLVARVVQKYRISSKGSLETLRLKAGVSIRAIDGWKLSITKV